MRPCAKSPFLLPTCHPFTNSNPPQPVYNKDQHPVRYRVLSCTLSANADQRSKFNPSPYVQPHPGTRFSPETHETVGSAVSSLFAAFDHHQRLIIKAALTTSKGHHRFHDAVHQHLGRFMLVGQHNGF